MRAPEAVAAKMFGKRRVSGILMPGQNWISPEFVYFSSSLNKQTMKKLPLMVMALLLFSPTRAQDGGVSRSVFGIQTGFLGLWAFNEVRLCDQIALRTELGLDAGFVINSWYNDWFVLTPVMTAEPRWYFNLKAREENGRKIAGNNGNFLSLKTSFHPGGLEISNSGTIQVVPNISVVPTLGIRRHIGQHFAFETGFGVGWQYAFWKRLGYSENESSTALNLHLRLGYTF